MNYFISDTHFADEKTFEIERRPFKSVQVFDKFMLKQFNKQAKKGDTIYVVGDMLDCDGLGSESWKKAIHYVKKIKAQVVLVMGNNEDRIVKYYFNNNFKKFKEYCLSLGYKDVVKNAYVTIGKQKLYLAHKPSQCKKNMMNLFGHVHRDGGLYYPFGLNVSCDLNFFRLYSEDDIMLFFEKAFPYWQNDIELQIKFK